MKPDEIKALDTTLTPEQRQKAAEVFIQVAMLGANRIAAALQDARSRYAADVCDELITALGIGLIEAWKCDAIDTYNACIRSRFRQRGEMLMMLSIEGACRLLGVSISASAADLQGRYCHPEYSQA